MFLKAPHASYTSAKNTQKNYSSETKKH